LIQRQPQHLRRRVHRQRILPVHPLRVRKLCIQHQAEKRHVKNDVRTLGARFSSVTRRPLLTLQDFGHDRLIQAPFCDQLPALAVNFHQQHFSRGIDEAHATQVQVELPAWRSRMQLPPALLQRANPRACQSPLYT